MRSNGRTRTIPRLGSITTKPLAPLHTRHSNGQLVRAVPRSDSRRFDRRDIAEGDTASRVSPPHEIQRNRMRIVCPQSRSRRVDWQDSDDHKAHATACWPWRHPIQATAPAQRKPNGGMPVRNPRLLPIKKRLNAHQQAMRLYRIWCRAEVGVAPDPHPRLTPSARESLMARLNPFSRRTV